MRTLRARRRLTKDAGDSLDKRGRKATAGYAKFDRLYEAFKADLQPSTVEEWDAVITAYEADPSLPDPYYWKPTGE